MRATPRNASLGSWRPSTADGVGDPDLDAYAGGDPVNCAAGTVSSSPPVLGVIAAPLIVAAVSGTSAAFETALADYGNRGRIDWAPSDRVGISDARTTLGEFTGRWSTPIGGAVVGRYVQDSPTQSRVPPDLNRTAMAVKTGTGCARPGGPSANSVAGCSTT